MRLTFSKSVLAVLLVAYPLAGAAYVGPGLGAGAIGVVLGVIGSILLAVFAIFWYPFKRMMRRRKQKQIKDNAEVVETGEDVVQTSKLEENEGQPGAERQG